MTSLRPSFSKPNEQFFAIFILLELHIAPAELSTLIFPPESQSEVTHDTKLFAAAKPGWISKFSYLEEGIFVLVFECRGSLRLVTLAVTQATWVWQRDGIWLVLLSVLLADIHKDIA